MGNRIFCGVALGFPREGKGREGERKGGEKRRLFPPFRFFDYAYGYVSDVRLKVTRISAVAKLIYLLTTRAETAYSKWLFVRQNTLFTVRRLAGVDWISDRWTCAEVLNAAAR